MVYGSYRDILHLDSPGVEPLKQNQVRVKRVKGSET